MGKAFYVLIAMAVVTSVMTRGLLAQESPVEPATDFPRTQPLEVGPPTPTYSSPDDLPPFPALGEGLPTPPHFHGAVRRPATAQLSDFPHPHEHSAFGTDDSIAYVQTDYASIIDTRGWPVPMPFRYYPQGIVNEDGTGIYQCLVPPDPVPDCFCTPPPCYFGTFYVEGVALDRRSNLERMGLFFDSTVTEVFNTGDFDLETEAGFRLGFWACDPCGIDWNLDYFSVQNFQHTESRFDAAGLTSTFFGFTDAPVTTLTAEYESNLDSIEFTVRTRQWRRIAPLIGIRFIQVDEEFNSLTDVNMPSGSFSQTDNELFGMQFGFHGLVCEHHCWRLETTVKAGPYYNDIDVEATANSTAGTSQNIRLDHNALSFAGDVRVGLVCQLGPRVNFRIGYQALWLEGIAVAPNQNNDISFTTNLSSIDLSGVLYQGGHLGFDMTW